MRLYALVSLFLPGMIVYCTPIEYENEFIVYLEMIQDICMSSLSYVNIFLKDTWYYLMFTFLSIVFVS